MNSNYSHLPYNPEKLPRELKKYYISLTQEEIDQMLKELGLNRLDDLFKHIPSDYLFKKTPEVSESLEYQQLLTYMENLAQKNNPKTSFIGDGLKNYKVGELVPFVSNIRGLSTAYTPYQPERSQGTLTSLWIYSSTLSMLTGFEAINASMYDRSTCLFEALNTATRLVRKSDSVIVCQSIYPGDLEVLKTLAKETKLNIVTAPLDPQTGLTDFFELKKIAKKLAGRLAAIAFPQVNSLGNLEDVHSLTDYCHEIKVKALAIIDPMLLATGGLVPPSQFGSDKKGADLIVGEGQHLAIGPNWGGPGLGIFGIRYNKENKMGIRTTPGRYVGKGKDEQGKDALAMVLSTREQHIRREKACSNICSNQSFIATLAGAAILERGEKGMGQSCQKSRQLALQAAKQLLSFSDIKLAFPQTPFFNEFVIELPTKASDLIERARLVDLHLGVDISDRINNGNNYLLISFFDLHSSNDLDKLYNFFKQEFSSQDSNQSIVEIPQEYLRESPVGLPNFSLPQLKEFYTKLGKQNVSPDEFLYPLGSCTMKYNPFINDYVASLPGFTDIHPQALLEDAQASLEILYHTQEMFKKITGLPGVTTQPLAGAQGELVGIKMFQAYHRDKGELDRNIILIPRSAHGTNPATATMAGFENKTVDGIKYGIITVEANNHGQIDMESLGNIVKQYGKRISGIMVTNPNTSGIFECQFKEMADLIHSVDGLVYMDGANMNAIAGWVDLNQMGVDAVHNNLHKTWSISHGGGGPGDAIVAVSEKLIDFLPGILVEKFGKQYQILKAKKSIGSFHRHFGNFAHKVRCHAYLKALGSEGIKHMSAIAVLSARYLYHKIKKIYPTLPFGAEEIPRMHEFILSISQETFDKAINTGTPRAITIAKVGKLFLDFGMHAPTVAFPEIFGLMIEPTESFTKSELDRFVEVLKAINHLLQETPEVLTTVPHFTPVAKVDEVDANKNIQLSQELDYLPTILENKIDPNQLGFMKVDDICREIVKSHQTMTNNTNSKN